ncbi:MAG: alpha-amylase family glycosyl hydrolase [Candidatus Wallbacteria bacterium]|nr:alpha-amylase family glycosyl hydrolase [Candidatus Wallbacteria bacterium]
MNFNWLETVFSCPSAQFLNPEYPKQGEEIIISIRVSRENRIRKIFLRTSPEGEEILQEMQPGKVDRFFLYYSITTRFYTAKISYRFFIMACDGRFYHYNNRGIQSTTPLDCFDFKLLTERSPSWTAEAVFYQIFPDRFYNGNPARNYRDNEYSYQKKKVKVRQWGETPGSFSGALSTYQYIDFYNGDLEGILTKLDYLNQLGVNCLYLTPIFLSPSNHKYDTQDYFEIDPHLGDKKVFSELTAELRRRGMRIILDGVFNHSGISCSWFNQSSDKSGACSSDPSFREFYTFLDKDKYECWLGVSSLPKLNFKSVRLRDLLYRKSDSVMQYWMREPFSIDGWRYDVANMLARQKDFQEYVQVWHEIRIALKSLNPESYLMGEHFFDGTELLTENCLDGLMNYQGFYFPIYRWLTGKSDFKSDGRGQNLEITFTGLDAAAQMQDFFSAIPWQKALGQYNLLNSHDRPRLISVLGGDLNKLKTAILALFTFPGIPSLFYGDEIGLEGLRDPDCRRCMIWEERDWNSGLLSHYKKLIKLRKKSGALQSGSFQWLHSDEKSLSFSRFNQSETLVTVLSPENKAVLVPVWRLGYLDGEAESALTEQKFKFRDGFLESTGSDIFRLL